VRAGIRLGVSFVASAVLFAFPAGAGDGLFPASRQIVFSPTDPNVVVGMTTYGLLPSQDNGKTWAYVCEGALGLYNGYEEPELTLTANGLVVGLLGPQSGLSVSKNLGCNWNCVGGGLAGQQIADVIARPDAPHSVLALTKTFNDAGAYSQVFQSTDDGNTWSALGAPLDATFLAETLGLVVGDPTTIYVTGERNYGAARTASLFVSRDGAATWTEHPVPQFDPTSEQNVLMAAVDPGDGYRVYLRSRALSGGGSSNLYMTTDGGNSFVVAKTFVYPRPQVVTDYGELMSFALSPDGSKVYVGSPPDGLWMASRGNLNFTQVNANVRIQCLATRNATSGPELWACSDELSGFIIGRSTDDGAFFEVKMATVTSLKGPLSCSPSATATGACGVDGGASSVCNCTDYTNLCSYTEQVNSCLGCGQGPEGGSASADAAATADTGTGDAAAGARAGVRSSGCGCSTVGSSRPAGPLADLALAGLALTRRRARRAARSVHSLPG
jgi:MYXO-CTERM domain-containing protein